jgi:hypothetical protein
MTPSMNHQQSGSSLGRPHLLRARFVIVFSVHLVADDGKLCWWTFVDRVAFPDETD